MGHLSPDVPCCPHSWPCWDLSQGCCCGHHTEASLERSGGTWSQGQPNPETSTGLLTPTVMLPGSLLALFCGFGSKGGNMGCIVFLPKKICWCPNPISSECDLIWKQGNQIKISKLGWTAIQYVQCPYRKGKFGFRERHRRGRWCEDTERMPPTSRDHLRPLDARREAWKACPSQPSEGVHPADTLISHCQPPELWGYKFPLFKPPSLWYFVPAAQGD